MYYMYAYIIVSMYSRNKSGIKKIFSFDLVHRSFFYTKNSFGFFNEIQFTYPLSKYRWPIIGS